MNWVRTPRERITEGRRQRIDPRVIPRLSYEKGGRPAIAVLWAIAQNILGRME